VPARWRSVLAQAAILVPPRHRDLRQKEWARRCQEAHDSLLSKEHAVLRNLLNPLQLRALQHYMRGLRGEGYLSADGRQVKERVAQHNEPMARFFHQPLNDLINRFTPAATKPSYCFAAHYQAGAELKRHTDRPQCVWNLSFAIDSTPATDATNAWPLYIESRGQAHEIRLGPGDAVLYSGTHNPHWREPQPDGHVSTLVFYHFVPADFDGGLD
jgi:alkylated DNA repair dioxygenase AlkB